MKKYLLNVLFFLALVPRPFSAPAQRLPESCRDSTPSLKDCYAPYFALGAASYASDEEEERIKDQQKEEKKKAKEAKKKEKASEKERKKAEKAQKKNRKKQGRGDSGGSSDSSDSGDSGDSSDSGDSDGYGIEDEDDDEDGPGSPEPEEKSSYFITTVGKHFTELSSGTELLPARLLGKKPGKLSRFTASDGYSYEVPARWNSKYLALFLEDAKKAGVQVRFHLLVCPEMSPDWFFFRGYDTAARLAGRDEMAARLEWYVKTVTDFIADWEYEHNQGKALVTAYDVAAELFTDAGGLNRTPANYLMKIFGDASYAVTAFTAASRRVPESVRLCYCDHSLFEAQKASRVKEFIAAVRSADGKARVDEIGIISHLTADWPDRKAFFDACRDFSSLQLGVQIQQLDMAVRGGTAGGRAYYDFMQACVQNASYIQGVSFRAVLASEETEFVDYMRSPLFSSDYSCTENFDQIIEASGRRTGGRQ